MSAVGISADVMVGQIQAADKVAPSANAALLVQVDSWVRANACAPSADDRDMLIAVVKSSNFDPGFKAVLESRIGNSIVTSTTGQQELAHPENYTQACAYQTCARYGSLPVYIPFSAYFLHTWAQYMRVHLLALHTRMLCT